MSLSRIQIPCMVLVLLAGVATADDRGNQDPNFQQSPGVYLHGHQAVPQVPGRGSYRILEYGVPPVTENRNSRDQSADMLMRRIRSLNIAADNLREAGFPEEAERLQSKAAELERERRERMGSGGHEELRDELVALRNVIVQLRSEVSALRREIEHLERHRPAVIPQPAIPQPYLPQLPGILPGVPGTQVPMRKAPRVDPSFGVNAPDAQSGVKNGPQIRPRIPLEQLDQPVPSMIDPRVIEQASPAESSEAADSDSAPKVELKFEQTETPQKTLKKSLPETQKKTPGK